MKHDKSKIIRNYFLNYLTQNTYCSKFEYMQTFKNKGSGFKKKMYVSKVNQMKGFSIA